MFPGTMRRVPRDRTATSYGCECALDLDALIQQEGNHHSLPARMHMPRCHFHELLDALPMKYRGAPWKIAFSSDDDGYSLEHLYRELDPYAGMAGILLLMVEDKNTSTPTFPREGSASPTSTPPTSSSRLGGVSPRSPATTSPSASSAVPPGCRIIGAFVEELPTLRHGTHAFFGGKESFVFRWPEGVSSSRSGKGSATPADDKTGLEVYSWHSYRDLPGTTSNATRADGSSPAAAGPQRRGSFGKATMNEEFMVCTHHFIGIGGGELGAAIFLDEELQYATSSECCQTFDSPSLHGAPPRGLHHAELAVIHTVWFAIPPAAKTKPTSFALPIEAGETWHKQVKTPGCRCREDPRVSGHHRCEFINEFLVANPDEGQKTLSSSWKPHH